MSITAMKQALEALENTWEAGANGVADAITALRQAIEQAEQDHIVEANKKVEAPAWWPAVENILNEYGLQAIDFVSDFKNAMQAQPQEATRKPLSDEEIKALRQWYPSHETGAVLPLIRAIEQAHGIGEQA